MDIDLIKRDFPIFEEHPHTYLDNAATTHKPKPVIRALDDFYQKYYGTVHRGIYQLAAEATAAYERARVTIQHYINANDRSEIVFTSGATDAINLVAHTFLKEDFTPGNNVVTTVAEHHANFIPWQQQALKNRAEFRCIPVLADGTLDMKTGLEMIDLNTKIVAINHISNVVGIINPIESVTARAREVGACILVDAAQSIAHLPIDVQELDCDFLVFSGHKIYGPTGIGVLYGKKSLLDQMPPYRFGGEMIEHVSVELSSFRRSPYRFEAGTPNAAGAIGLAASIDYLQGIGMAAIQKHNQELTKYLETALQKVPEIRLVGSSDRQRYGVVSFVMDQVHPHDIASILDHHRVSIRAGHHCAQPLLKALGLNATARASIGIYNNEEDISNLMQALVQVKKIFT